VATEHGEEVGRRGVGAPAGRRLVGVDVARASPSRDAARPLRHLPRWRPGWLEAVDDVADGRAAPLFCVLLGLGAGLLLARGRTDATLLGRGAALFVLGLLLWPLVPEVFVILPHHGILLALVVLLRRLPAQALLPAAALAFVVPSLVVAAVGSDDLRSGGQPDSYADLLDVPDVVAGLVWTGATRSSGGPASSLVGLLLARLPLADRSVQRRLVVVGAVVGGLQPLAAAAWARSSEPLTSALLDSRAHSNQLAWYVLASATAVAVIGACLLVADRAARAPPPAAAPRPGDADRLRPPPRHRGVARVAVARRRPVARRPGARGRRRAGAVRRRGRPVGRPGRRGPVEAVLRAIAP
jgi:hypothetical protein